MQMRRINPSAATLIIVMGFLFCRSSLLFSDNADSKPADDTPLIERLESATGEKKLEVLLELSRHFVFKSPEKVIAYASQAFALAETLGLDKEMGRALTARATGYLHSGRLDEAETDYRAGLVLGESIQNHSIIGASLNGIAAVALKRGDANDALAHFQRAIRHIRLAGDRQRLAGIFSNISLIHYRGGELRKSLDFMLKALAIYEELKYRPGIGVVLNSIGNVYNRLNNPDQAMDHFNKALKIARETSNLQLVTVCLVNIGEIHKGRGDWSRALSLFNEAYKSAEKLGSPDYMAVSRNNMGDVYSRQGYPDKALRSYRNSLELFEKMNAKPRMAASHLNIGNVYLDLNQLKLAEKHLREAVRLAVATESRSLQKDAVWSLIRLYETRGEFTRALSYFREYTTLQTQLFSHENYAKLTALQAKYESENLRRQKQIRESAAQIETLQKKRKSLLLLYIITAILLALLLLIIFYRRYRLRMRTNLELREAYSRMEQMAKYDSLTRLYNRRSIMERIEIEMVRLGRTWRPFALIMMDVDGFKQVNDTYGHECGDQVLVHLSELINRHLRKQDVASRWGGEEFLLMLPETTMDGAEILAEKVRGIVESTPTIYQEHKIGITVTLGINVFSKPGPVSECIRGADNAMYFGKKKGKNTVVRVDRIPEAQLTSIPN